MMPNVMNDFMLIERIELIDHTNVNIYVPIHIYNNRDIPSVCLSYISSKKNYIIDCMVNFSYINHISLI